VDIVTVALEVRESVLSGGRYKHLLVTDLGPKPGYVLALLFTADGKRVVLMRRTKPAWQSGRVNALGGRLVGAESPGEAARREVREECGVDVEVEEWSEVLVWDDAEYRMYVTRAISDRAREARTMEDQEVFLADVNALPANVIDNLRWLVPLALDREVAMPISVRSAAAEGSGLTERDRVRE
jgi:8-oxo-dGTP diphosphatase